MKEDGVLFYEIQKFKQRWLWIVIIGIILFLLYGVYKQIVMGETWGVKPMGNTGLIIATISAILISYLFHKSKLETKIKEDGVYVRFYPLHNHFKHYNWDSLVMCHIRHYNAITEFGGWGFRFSVFGAGKAYNVSGDMGLQLKTKSGKKLLIGTLKSKEITAVLKQLNQIKE